MSGRASIGMLLALTGLLVACAPDPVDTGPGEPGAAAPDAVASDTSEPVPMAETDRIAAGRKKSASCRACHGALGDSDNEHWPDLAGQSAEYLAKQLKDFRDGRRYDPWMSPMAQNLNNQDIDDIAAWYASIDGVSGGPDKPAPATMTCVACHSARAGSTNPLWPSLAGQNERYLVKALHDFRDGRRKDPVMAPLALPLSDEQIQKVAAVYANP